MIVRYATEADIRAFLNGAPYTMRAVVAEHEGRILGYAGIVYGEGFPQVVSSISDELRAHKVTMGRAARMVRSIVAQHRGTLIAHCNPNEPTSPRLLAYVGMTEWEQGWWIRG